MEWVKVVTEHGVVVGIGISDGGNHTSIVALNNVNQ